MTSIFAATTSACRARLAATPRSEEHTSELQSRLHLVCRLLLEKKKKTNSITSSTQSKVNQPSQTLYIGQLKSPCHPPHSKITQPHNLTSTLPHGCPVSRSWWMD